MYVCRTLKRSGRSLGLSLVLHCVFFFSQKSSPYQGLEPRSTQEGLKGLVDETAPYVTFVVENEMGPEKRGPEKLDQRPHVSYSFPKQEFGQILHKV